ncbi:glucoamylase [Coprinopsis sp. MPI-PUGE-AT-0042]|nr:glucoamylase [Coprinopsis sp. MPI-PUGE-AT-0042]
MLSAFLTTAFAFFSLVGAQSNPAVDTFLAKEVPIAKRNLVANIGPDGAKVQGAKAGVVIASPSTSDPDYLFTWTRDAGLVMKEVADAYARGEDSTHRKRLDDYVAAQTILQNVNNPSGSLTTGGLGEPKFEIDLTAFTGSWGRPQRDGPPLRATAMIAYANWLIDNGNTTWVNQRLWPVIKNDLDYTAKYWNYTGFDLWEEISSASFFTTAIQHRALREGATLATKLGQSSSASSYLAQAPNVLCFLQSYWNSAQSYITSNTGGGRSGKDANSVLASIHTFDKDAGCDAATFQPCSDKALANHKAYVDAFRSIYPINSGIPSSQAVATGRYSEDVYYGGQPWYLTTAAASEQLYFALQTWDRVGSIQITSLSLPFFRQIYPSAAVGTYAKSSSTYTALINAVRAYADGFLAVVAKYTPADGALAEQYHRQTGLPLSAKDLTWSYSSILTANVARSGVAPRSWGAAGLTVPSQCNSNIGPTAQVTFNVRAETVFGENIFLTGSIDSLKAWSPENALALSAANYPTWSVTVNIPVNTNFEYKYIRKNNGQVTWESDPNRSNSSPSSGSKTISDTWK